MIETTSDRGISLLEMRRGKVNAMSVEFCVALSEALEEARDSQTRGVILKGNDRVFSAGVDLVRVVNEPVEYLDAFMPELISLFMQVFLFPKPIVAALTGHAIAGGCVVASACDHRVISSRARIGVPELRVGVPFPSEGLEIMRSVATPTSFRKMIHSGATFTGCDAIAAGLADEVAEPEEVMTVARAALDLLLFVPPSVFALNKRQSRQPALNCIEQGNARFGSEINQLWRSPETRRHVEQYVATSLRSSQQKSTGT